MKPTQTPTARESITFTLTPEEQDMLLRGLEDTKFYLNGHYALYNKLHFLFTNIGDACRHSAHIPEAPGQGGTIFKECSPMDGLAEIFGDLRGELEEARLESFSLRKDAERYRFLRDYDQWGDSGEAYDFSFSSLAESTNDGFDAIVDGRMSKHMVEFDSLGQGGTTQTDVSSHPFYCVCDVCRTYLDFYDEADKGQGGNQ